MSYSEQMIDSREALTQMYEYHDGDRRMKPVPMQMPSENPDRIEEDMVNNPSHYNTGGVECIDGIKSALSPEEYRGYLRGAAMKYLWRCTYKGKAKEDLDKAQWYMNKFKETEPC